MYSLIIRTSLAIFMGFLMGISVHTALAFPNAFGYKDIAAEGVWADIETADPPVVTTVNGAWSIVRAVVQNYDPGTDTNLFGEAGFKKTCSSSCEIEKWITWKNPSTGILTQRYFEAAQDGTVYTYLIEWSGSGNEWDFFIENGSGNVTLRDTRDLGFDETTRVFCGGEVLDDVQGMGPSDCLNNRYFDYSSSTYSLYGGHQIFENHADYEVTDIDSNNWNVSDNIY